MQAILVGYGAMGQRHHKRLLDLGVSFITILDSESDWNTFKKSIHSISRHDTFALIASPANTHAKYVLFFLKHGFPIFVEKPLAIHPDEIQAILKVKKKHQTLFVGHSERYSPLFQRFSQDFIKNKNSIRKMKFVRSNPPSQRGLDVPVTLDLLVHDLDSFFSLFSPLSGLQFDITHAEMSSTEDSAKLELSVHMEHKLIVEFYAHRNATKTERRVDIFETHQSKSYPLLFNKNTEHDPLFYEYQAFFEALKDSNKNKETLNAACLAVETAFKIKKTTA